MQLVFCFHVRKICRSTHLLASLYKPLILFSTTEFVLYQYPQAVFDCQFLIIVLKVLSEALTVLERMKHRGAVGCEESCGDGAGIMTGIPHAFYEQVIQ